MPAVKPLSPAAIKNLLEGNGYELIAADEHNWAFAKQGEKGEPVIVPSAIPLVPLEVAFNVARKVGFGDYFEALSEVLQPPSAGDQA